jgi:hypothetical protein
VISARSWQLWQLLKLHDEMFAWDVAMGPKKAHPSISSKQQNRPNLDRPITTILLVQAASLLSASSFLQHLEAS